jgi:hypothetical protein
MSGSAAADNSKAVGFGRIFPSAAKRAVWVGAFTSVVVWTLISLEVHQILPIGRWYRTLPYSVQHPVDFLLLPGGVVWWCTMNYTGSELLGLVLGFVASTVAYSLLLLVPITVLEFLVVSAKPGMELP